MASKTFIISHQTSHLLTGTLLCSFQGSENGVFYTSLLPL